MDLYVSNLGDKITDESLRAIFATYGKVNSSKIVKEDGTAYSRGFALIEMPNTAEAENAIANINGAVVNGKNLSVKEARTGGLNQNNFY